MNIGNWQIPCTGFRTEKVSLVSLVHSVSNDKDLTISQKSTILFSLCKRSHGYAEMKSECEALREKTFHFSSKEHLTLHLAGMDIFKL